MSKEIFNNLDAREGLKRGVDTLANAVKVTLGPKGRNVAIQTPYGHHITKDGVTVAKEISLTIPIENMGAQMVKEVAFNVNESAGDGTTTATVLAQAIVAKGLKYVVAGANPIDLKRGMDKTCKSIVSKIKEKSIEVKGKAEIIRNIATISANNDEEIGDLIAKAFEKVGDKGIINVEESRGMETSIEIIRGYRFNRGYTSKYFINVPVKKEIELNKPNIILYDGKINDISPLIGLISSYASAKEDLLIIASDISEQANMDLVMHKLNLKSNIALVKAPYKGDRRTDTLEDLSVLLNAKLLSESKGHTLNQVTPGLTGSAEKVIINNNTTTIINGSGFINSLTKRIEDISKLSETLLTDYEKNIAKERIAKLQGSIAILYIGAISEVELKEKRDRVNDALSATRAAIEEGIVIGGGLAIIRASKACYKKGKGDEKLGAQIIFDAVLEPFKQIIRNGGDSPDVVLNRILEGNNSRVGYDAKNGIYVDMIKEGIIDPAKVVRVALENAVSVAGMILTTECALTIIPENQEANINNLFNNI